MSVRSALLFRRVFRPRVLLHVLWALALLGVPQAARGATFVVNSTIDTVDAAAGDGVCATDQGVCTLRAAIQEANAFAGADVIALPGGTYLFAMGGRGEQFAATGDLNVTSEITVNGAGAGSTIIDAAGLDRVFAVSAPGKLTVADVTLQNGDAGATSLDRGGGIYALGGTSLTLGRCVVRANVAHSGGGIAVIGMSENSSSLTLSDTTISGNSALAAEGAGVYLSGAQAVSFTMTDSAVVGNHADSSQGGGIYSAAMTSIRSSTVSGNTAANGGGLSFSTSGNAALIDRSTFSGNTATTSGGGIRTDGMTTVVNSTISGNSAGPNAGNGSGIVILREGTVLTNVTITANTGRTGAVFLFGVVQVTNSLVANNSPQVEQCTISGSGSKVNTLGHNLEFPTGHTCRFTHPTDRLADPVLGPLADNGGPTGTHALLQGSGAIDGGDNTVCAASPVSGVDQRAFARPVGVSCDIGAYEAGASPRFTDDPLQPSTLIRAVHFTELRTRIDELRERFGLAPVAWTDAVLTGLQVRSVHVQELRDGLTEAYNAAKVAPPSFADSPPVPGETPIRTIHVEELRASVVALESVPH